MNIITLRDMIDSDISILFEHQREPEANQMTGFPARDWDAHLKHYTRIRADRTVLTQTILCDGQVAGSIGSYLMDGEREIGYWIGKAFWGQGVMTRALELFLQLETTRPLYAHVAKRNPASLRVLQKCGFVLAGEGAWSPVPGEALVEEYTLRLDGP